MSVSIITITHDNIGKEIYKTSCMIFASCLNNYEHIGLKSTFDLDKLADKVSKLIIKLDVGDGVLILTDIFGASPSNLACRFSGHDNVKVITGLNLAMMLKVANKNDLPLAKLCKEVLQAGRNSINEH